MAFSLTACKCKHAETQLVNAKEASCTADGCTGDVVCIKFEETVTAGSVIPAAGHVEGEPDGFLEATCVTEGYTGSIYCETCGELLVKGENVPITEHVPGELINIKELTCTELGYSGDPDAPYAAWISAAK